jgi:hypothetical protein
MNKNTMFYGLLVAGGLLAYFAWKKNKANAEKEMTSPTSTSGTFVDDVSVLETGTGGIKPPRPILKNEILEPFISKKKQLDLSGELI